MTGSLHDAEDLTQEALLKAWQARDGFRGDAAISTWLYRIATNLCLDFLRGRKSRMLPGAGRGRLYRHGDALPEPDLDAAWLEPYPTPEDAAIQREHLSLAFVALLQTVPARQRGVLLLADVLEYPSKEIAELLGMTVPAVNSALQRARRTVGTVTRPETVPMEVASAAERFLAAWDKGDALAIVALMGDDTVMVMPPYPVWVHGAADILRVLTDYPLNGARRWKLVPAGFANGDPAFGFYSLTNGRWEGWGVQVISCGAGPLPIVRCYVFKGPQLLPAFGLPLVLSRA
jgi:RNA polymerase sigma-70 factor (ECF subfamily)